jgi:hypothetical protein
MQQSSPVDDSFEHADMPPLQMDDAPDPSQDLDGFPLQSSECARSRDNRAELCHHAVMPLFHAGSNSKKEVVQRCIC